MHPRARRTLRWIFILTFLLIAPAIVLSTAGYRYNFSTWRLERTGVLVVESRPAGAAVTLNGELQRQESPAHFGNLAPGAYDVRIGKAGYLPWEKRVPVASRTTSFLNRITLYRQAEPAAFGPSGTFVHPVFSPDARYAAAMTATRSGSELTIVDLRSGTNFLPYRSSSGTDAFALSWSPDGRYVLITQPGPTGDVLLWSAQAPESVRDMKRDTDLPLNGAFWSQDASRLHATAGSALYGFAPETLVPEPEGPSVAAPVIADGTLYGIEKGSPAKLVRRPLTAPDFEAIAELPSTAFRPLPANGRIGYVALGGNDLFAIDQKDGRPTAFEVGGSGGAWSADGERLLYWNDLEVRVRDRRSGAEDLVTRVGGPIVAAAWDRPDGNALYAVHGGLYAVEASDEYGRMTTPLASFDTIDGFAVGSAGDFAYVFGNKNGRSGLWRLPLR